MILAVLLVLSAGTNAYAAPVRATISDGQITPYWTNTSSINLYLSFTSSTANCSAIVRGKTGTTKITGTATLARKNTNGTYTIVKTWSGLSTNSNELIFNESYSVSSGYTYKLTINATVYMGSNGENVSSSVEKYNGWLMSLCSVAYFSFAMDKF